MNNFDFIEKAKYRIKQYLWKKIWWKSVLAVDEVKAIDNNGDTLLLIAVLACVAADLQAAVDKNAAALVEVVTNSLGGLAKGSAINKVSLFGLVFTERSIDSNGKLAVHLAILSIIYLCVSS